MEREIKAERRTGMKRSCRPVPALGRCWPNLQFRTRGRLDQHPRRRVFKRARLSNWGGSIALPGAEARGSIGWCSGLGESRASTKEQIGMPARSAPRFKPDLRRAVRPDPSSSSEFRLPASAVFAGRRFRPGEPYCTLMTVLPCAGSDTVTSFEALPVSMVQASSAACLALSMPSSFQLARSVTGWLSRLNKARYSA